jgi:hypothetical protein
MNNPNRALLISAFSGMVCLSFVSGLYATIASDILALTGNRQTRVVWCRSISSSNGEFGAGNWDIVTFSTATGQETVILGSGPFISPKITHDGQRIVYVRSKGGTNSDLRIVDWNGANDKLISADAAIGCLWYDEVSGKEYAFATTGSGCNERMFSTSAPLYKINLADATDRTQIPIHGAGYPAYGSDQLSPQWLSISRDGTHLAGSFPWTGTLSNAANYGGGIINIANGVFTSFRTYGCWTSTPPDNSYRFVIYPVDSHDRWKVISADQSSSHIVYLGPPEFNGTHGTYEARFAVNDPGFVTVSTPRCFDGSFCPEKSRACLMKIDANITSVTGHVFVSAGGNYRGDIYPCAWIDPGTAPAQPAIAINPTALSYSATAGGADPASQTVTVTNSGAGTLTAVNISKKRAWLAVTLSGSGNTQTVTNAIALGTLAAGTYRDTVTVSGGGASNSATYIVTLTVVQQPLALSAIMLSPDSAAIAPNTAALFSAQCKDQNGNPFAAIVNWKVTGGGAVSHAAGAAAAVSDTCSFISNGTVGTFRVIAYNGAVADTAPVRVSSDLIRAITVTAPASGSRFAVGNVMNIQWTATSNIAGVVIKLTTDKGRHWGSIVNQALPIAPGTYAWTVTSTIPSVIVTDPDISTISDSVTIRVIDYFGADTYGQTTNISIRGGMTAQSSPTAPRNARLIVDERGISVPWSGPWRIALCDIRGRCPYSINGTQAGTFRLDAARPAPGTYTLIFTSAAHTFAQRICLR